MISVHNRNLPRFDPTTGGFIGGIQTNYEYFNIPRRQKASPDGYSSDEDDEEDDKDPSTSRPYVVKQNRKPQSHSPGNMKLPYSDLFE